ncbi:hypothetical protein OHA18_36820 [Kribbella sp. NBC_00709]|uniref:hypothetical protein n=1 Tax=Kribbella sp. NBC_00709 TaxID=2975972 RepID=UPI002E2A9A25|nr:hypothetical protein [Kribbella sp. NBC_00709]
MTDLLRDTLAERADGAEPPPLDLDAIVATGNRQISRRRALTVLGGAVATAAVTVGGATLIRPREPRPQPARPAPFTERRAATFALGNTIHYGADVIPVAPNRINAFVQTDAGFVFLDAGNNIHIADRAGVRGLGKGAWSLTADHSGSLVAWSEGFNDHYESVVYDVAAGRELVRTPVGNKIPPGASLAYGPEIVAIDGTTAYFGTLDGLYRWDIPTNKGELIADVSPIAVRTVVAGQLVYQQPLSQPLMGHTLKVGPTLTSGTRTTFSGQQAFLSPRATYLVTQPNDAQPGIQPVWADLQLFGVTAATGGSLPRTAYRGFRFGQWLDDTTFTAAGVQSGSRTQAVDLLTLNAETGAHTVVAPEFSTFTFSATAPRTTPFALPTGAPIYDLY